jgi:hypothetical protein
VCLQYYKEKIYHNYKKSLLNHVLSPYNFVKSHLANVSLVVSVTIMILLLVAAVTTTSAYSTTSAPPPSAGIKLSPQPVYQKHTPPGNTFPINQTYIGATHSGNGTLTLPNSTQTINMTINGTAIISLATSSVQIKETMRAENGETVNVTGYEAIHFNNPAAAPEGGGRSIVTAILQTNSTGILAPLNGTILAGIDDFDSDGDSQVTLWRWESGIPLPTGNNTTTATEQSPSSSLMNTTTTTNATAANTNVIAATIPSEEEVVVEEQQQQATPTAPAP